MAEGCDGDEGGVGGGEEGRVILCEGFGLHLRGWLLCKRVRKYTLFYSNPGFYGRLALSVDLEAFGMRNQNITVQYRTVQ